MKVRSLRFEELIELGDRIKVETALGTQWQTVIRVTKKYAFVRYNERAEGKYIRLYNDFGFEPLPRQRWGNNRYSAWRPVDSSSDGDNR